MSESKYKYLDDPTLAIVEEPTTDYNKIGENKENESISIDELNFKYQLIKGRIGENLIQELFLSEGYQVYKYGIENTHPFLLQQIKSISSDQSLSLRIAPDLIIFDSEDKEIYYAEVKFCANGKYKLSSKIDIAKYKSSYPNTIFFIISTKGIYEVNIDVFENSRTINLDEENEFLIEKKSIFNLRINTISHFNKLSKIFFSDLPSHIKS